MLKGNLLVLPRGSLRISGRDCRPYQTFGDWCRAERNPWRRGLGKRRGLWDEFGACIRREGIGDYIEAVNSKFNPNKIHNRLVQPKFILLDHLSPNLAQTESELNPSSNPSIPSKWNPNYSLLKYKSPLKYPVAQNYYM